MHPLVDHVRTVMATHRLWPANRRLLVAVSGGVDSVALFRVLHQLAPETGVRLVLAHAHHQLRGHEADRDAALVETLGRELDCPCVVGRLAVREALEQSGESLEMVARRLRHAFLARCAREQKVGAVALAHHAGDQAELFFLRLFRGAGGDGLGGMKRRSPSPADPGVTLIRPLLDVPKALLLDFAAAEGIAFGEDSSNADRDILRNRIRHELLPLLHRDFTPAIEALTNRAAELVGAEAEFVRLAAARWLAATRRTRFENLHPAVQRAVIREQLWALGQHADFELIERLRLTEQRVSLDREHTVQRAASGKVRRQAARPPEFQRGEKRLLLRGTRGAAEFDRTQITWERRPAAKVTRLRSQPSCEQFDANAVGRRVVLRHWRPGDRFQPLGFKQPARLQDLLVNRKIPAARRRQLLVAATDQGVIFWVEELPPGEHFKLTPATRTRLLWSWKHTA